MPRGGSELTEAQRRTKLIAQMLNAEQANIKVTGAMVQKACEMLKLEAEDLSPLKDAAEILKCIRQNRDLMPAGSSSAAPRDETRRNEIKHYMARRSSEIFVAGDVNQLTIVGKVLWDSLLLGIRDKPMKGLKGIQDENGEWYETVKENGKQVWHLDEHGGKVKIPDDFLDKKRTAEIQELKAWFTKELAPARPAAVPPKKRR
jgi:hypothetical protein